MRVNLVLANEELGLKLSELCNKGYKIDALIANDFKLIDVDSRIGYINLYCKIILTRGEEFSSLQKED